MNLIQQNQKRWEECKINPSKDAVFTSVAQRLSGPEAKKRYKIVEARTGVPWWFIAVIHEREASQNWNSSLAQGDPWNKVSTHRPAGRGPFKSWEDAAVDALVNCAPYAARNKDWSPGGALTMWEKYNGLGYFDRGMPSPYVWAGTNQYVKGKYVADGVFDPNHVDQQLGCAGLAKKMNVFGAGAGTAAVIIGAGAAATAASTGNNTGYIIAGSIVGVIALWLLIRWYINRNQKVENV